MASGTIKKNGKKLRATATANTTWGDQLAELKPVFDALSEEEKREAYIYDTIRHYVFQCVSTVGAFSFFTITGGDQFTGEMLNLYSIRAKQMSGTTATDVTSSTAAVQLTLYA